MPSSTNSSVSRFFSSFFTLLLVILALTSSFTMVQSAPISSKRGSIVNSTNEKRVGGEAMRGALYSMGIPKAPDSYWSQMSAASASSASAAAQPTTAPARVQAVVPATPTSAAPVEAAAPTPATVDRAALYSMGIPPAPEGWSQRK